MNLIEQTIVLYSYVDECKSLLTLMVMYTQASKKWRQNMLDLSRQKVGAQLSAMNAATAQLVTMSIDDEIDTSRVGAAVAQM